MSYEIDLNVNGVRRRVDGTPGRSLLDVLREDLGLTGCKIGCGEGQCGACTVLVDRRPTRACITPASAMAGQPIVTIEGLEAHGQLHPLQQAFLDADAMQCGYCTPGMIMSALGLLHEHSNPTEQQIVAAMNGNICRCGAYSRIVDAIRQTATALRGEP